MAGRPTDCNSPLGVSIYWDWAAGGDLPAASQPGPALWTSAGIGGSGDPIPDRPFRASKFAVRIDSGRTGRLRSTDRGLRRPLGTNVATPPTTAQVRTARNSTRHDAAPWNRSSLRFRNRVDDWRP